MKAKILETINRIEAPDAAAMDAALSRQAALAKPPGSLGGLEDISVRMAGITGSLFNEINRSCVAVFCADALACPYNMMVKVSGLANHKPIVRAVS